jgi:hypothetical protein
MHSGEEIRASRDALVTREDSTHGGQILEKRSIDGWTEEKEGRID